MSHPLILDNICNFIVDTKHKTPKFTDTGYPCIRTPNIGRGFFNLKNAKYVSEASYVEWTERAIPECNDLIFAREAPVGNIAIIPEGLKVCHGQRTVLIRPDIKKIDPHYLMYLMLGDDLQGKIHSMANGATVPHLNMSDIRSLSLPEIPAIKIQKKISKLLYNYDNLIEKNNRRITILEKMAQSFYHEWFVKFRYPGHKNQKLANSLIGMIPDGWELLSASESIEINPRIKLAKEGEKTFVPMSGLSESSMTIGDITKKTGNSGAKFINWDTLFSRITPCLQNGKIGYVQFLTKEQPAGFGSTEFIILRETDKLSSEFIYLLARSYNFRENAIKSMTGATGRQRVKNECFASFNIAIPPKDLIKEFTMMVKPMFTNIYNLTRRSENLKKQRDMLLPKLISGQIGL